MAIRKPYRIIRFLIYLYEAIVPTICPIPNRAETTYGTFIGLGQALAMSAALFLAQLLNGFQLGVLLFLLSAGLTLVLGIMNCINLTHGSLYMIGAYVAAAAFGQWNSFVLAGLLAVLVTLVAGALIERLVLRRLYQRDHLYQVLGTFGLILFINELVRIIWGPSPLFINVPETLSGTVDILGLPYPAYRFAIIACGLVVAAALYFIIHKTRIGMLIRAGASNATMVSALGVNIARVNAVVFGTGAALAGLAGVMAAPILSVQPGMGEPILILTLVVIVTGGVGSIRGAFFGALIVGMVDTMGRALLPGFMRELFDRSFAQAAGPALASMLIYLLMAAVLAVRPQGLFPVKHG
jgi:branched-chain amino acid transport system permease protein